MDAPTKIRRWLTAVTLFHGTLLLVIMIGLMVKVNAVATDIRDSLLSANVAVEQVDKVNEEFSSFLSGLVWVLLAGLFLTNVSFSLLRRVISQNWPNPTSDQRRDSEVNAEPSITSK